MNLDSHQECSLQPCYQFEPESFVDSLLGIGLGSSKGEGKALASRLTEMRKERNTRAKATAIKAAPAPKLGGANPAGQLAFNAMGDNELSTDEGMQLITPGGGGSGGSSSKKKSTNKKKKKKVKR
jgi:hypothetical protein